MAEAPSTMSIAQARVMNRGNMVTIAISVIASIFIIATLYSVAKSITGVVATGSPTAAPVDARVNVRILQEIVRSSYVVGTHLDTHPSKADIVTDLRPSRNLRGGDQFSLSFKLAFEDENQGVDRCVLLWGDKNKVQFTSSDGQKRIERLMIFMPMIWVRTVDGKHVISVYFNTTGTVMNKVSSDLKPTKLGGSSTMDLSKGVDVTVSFADYTVNGTAAGCICKLYLDESSVGATTVQGQSIRRTRGLMYILPDIDPIDGSPKMDFDDNASSVSNLKISDLVYHNYEMRMAQIAEKTGGTMSFDTVVTDVNTRDRKSYDPRNDMTFKYLSAPSLW